MKKLNHKGFSAVEGLLILVIVAIIGFAGWYVWHSRNNANTSYKNTGNSNTASAAKKTTIQTKDPTADWVSYTSTEGRFSLKYPKTWVTASDPELCGKTLFLVGANSTSVGKCGSDDTGQMAFSSTPTSELTVSDQEMKKTDFPDVVTEKVTVDGIVGEKQTGTFEGDSLGIGLAKGQKTVNYLFSASNRTYIASYIFNAKYPDALNDFNTVVTKTLKFE